jgi:sugar phosphate permease
MVLALLCLAASIAYICRQSMAVAESTIREEFGIDKATMGWVMSLFFLPYAFGQIPGGVLCEKLGNRRTLPLLATGWSLATAAMSLSGGAGLLIAAFMANGLFQAGLFPGCTRAIASWFPSDRRAFASGTLASLMSLGGALGSAAMGLLLGRMGWRFTFVLFGSLGLVWALEFLSWFRDDPSQHRRVNEGELALIKRRSGAAAAADAAPEPGTPWMSLLASPATWFICGQQFCRAAGQIFFGSWFATYLQEARGVSIKASGLLNSLPQLSLIVGALLGGMVSDWVLSRTGSRRLARQAVASTCMFLCASFVALAYSLANPLLAVLTISAGLLLAAVGGPSAYAITIDMGGRHLAKLFSCMNMVGNIGAGLFIIGVPWFLRITNSWNTVLITFGGLYVAAGIFWLLLNPNGDIFQQSWKKEREVSRVDS